MTSQFEELQPTRQAHDTRAYYKEINESKHADIFFDIKKLYQTFKTVNDTKHRDLLIRKIVHKLKKLAPITIRLPTGEFPSHRFLSNQQIKEINDLIVEFGVDAERRAKVYEQRRPKREIIYIKRKRHSAS